MRNVTLKQLRAFVMIAAERSFTRAAARLHVSQSALTLQIRELEAEIGLRLFDRSTRSVELTAAAASFVPVATRLLDELERSLDDLQSLASREEGSVVVTAGASIISLIVAPAVAQLAKHRPGIAVRLVEDVGEGVARHVIDGAADFGIATFVRPSDVIETSLLLKDRIGVLCTRQHPLARKQGQIAWADLARHPFATLSQGTALRGTLDKHPDIGAALPQPTYEATSISALVALVEQGAGIALLPSLAASPSTGRRLVFRPIQAPAMFRELFFVVQRRRSQTPAARELLMAILNRLEAMRQARHPDVAMNAPQLAALRRSVETQESALDAVKDVSTRR